jgi:Cu+-exporting ATPase
MVRKGVKEESIPLSSLRIGDRMLIRSEEIIPADAVLLKGDASIDYSFVTGESAPVRKTTGDLIYAGGRQKGSMIELEVVKEVSQSYLTQLWNNDQYVKRQDESGFQQLVNRISHYFTFVILGVSLLALAYWLFQKDPLRGWNAFTAVLIIACPCALAISSPFTLGNILRIFGRHRFYLRGYPVIERLAKINTVVFDKTGTLTLNDRSTIVFDGDPLSSDEQRMIASLAIHSSHPYSRMVFDHLSVDTRGDVTSFAELPGKGIRGEVFGFPISLGSASFVNAPGSSDPLRHAEVHVSINGKWRGRFLIGNTYRPGAEELLKQLNMRGYRCVVLSGDNPTEEARLRKILGDSAMIRFRQSPVDKLKAIQELQLQGNRVLMVGDGLNDAGALKQADVGVSVSDDVNNFSPACDGILDGKAFGTLSGILRTAVFSRRIILGSFALALVYNIIGCWFAVQGALSPVMAAILMPLSTVTIIAFTTGFSNLLAVSDRNSC